MKKIEDPMRIDVDAVLGDRIDQMFAERPVWPCTFNGLTTVDLETDKNFRKAIKN